MSKQNNVEVDVTGIEEGKTYKNYTELCVALGQEEKTSNSKKAQIKNWERYFDFERDGQKYRIIEIYDSPMTPEKQLRQRMYLSKYYDYIHKSLLILLYKKGNETFDQYYTMAPSKYKLIETLGMISKNFREQYPELAKENVSYIKKEVFRDVRGFVTKLLGRSLQSLKNNKNIIYHYRTQVIDFFNGNHRYATEWEEKKISDIEGNVLRGLGCKSEYEASIKGLEDKYFERVTKQTKDKLGISGHYEVVEISIIKSVVLLDIKEIEAKYGNINRVLDDSVIGLNNEVVNALLVGNESQGKKFADGKKSEYVIAHIKEELENAYSNWIDWANSDYAEKYKEERDEYVKKYVKFGEEDNPTEI